MSSTAGRLCNNLLLYMNDPAAQRGNFNFRGFFKDGGGRFLERFFPESSDSCPVGNWLGAHFYQFCIFQILNIGTIEPPSEGPGVQQLILIYWRGLRFSNNIVRDIVKISLGVLILASIQI